MTLLLKNIVREALENCNIRGLSTSLLAKSTNGTVFIGCKKKCIHIIKVMNIRRKNIWDNEKKLQLRFYKYGLGPQVYCIQEIEKNGKKYGVIVMKRVSHVLEDYLKVKRRKSELRVLLGNILLLISKMCEYNLAHGDLHWGNIGFSKGIKHLVLFDFGWSSNQGCMVDLALSQLLRTLRRAYTPEIDESNRNYLKHKLVEMFQELYPEYNIKNSKDAEHIHLKIHHIYVETKYKKGVI